MPPYRYPLPTTSLLAFSNIFNDPSSSHTSALSEATAARTKLYLALKGVAENAPGSSSVAVLDAVQVYLPYLRGMIACLEADELLFKGEPVFPWCAPLTHYGFSQPLLPLLSIYSEHLMVILAYMLGLSNYAHSILSSLPPCEHSTLSKTQSHMSTEDEKKTTAGLTRAVDLLCQASGVADWAADNVCLQLEPVRSASGGRLRKDKWPAETSRETLKALSMTFLADAHLTAIRKLMLPVLIHTYFTPPGPPLPPNHPSAALLSKLYLHVNHLYNSSRALLKVHQQPIHTSNPSRKLLRANSEQEVIEPDSVEGDIISPIKRYLAKESLLALALAHKWLGVDTGENNKENKVGEALAWVKDAQNKLEELEDSKVRAKLKGLSLRQGNDKKREERMARKGRVERELEVCKAWVKAYQKINNTVTFQRIPPVTALVTPAGRPIFGAKPFTPPQSNVEPSMNNLMNENSDDREDTQGLTIVFHHTAMSLLQKGATFSASAAIPPPKLRSIATSRAEESSERRDARIVNHSV
ncbi:hypothetical protein L204_101094 [Cryptococcus depauperatus]